MAEKKPAKISSKTGKVEAKTDKAEAKTGKAEAKTGKAEAKTGKVEAKTDKAEAKTDKAEAKTGKVEVKTDKAEAKTGKCPLMRSKDGNFKDVRYCPVCETPFISDEGECNQVTCMACSTHICIACMQAIDQANPSTHFAKSAVIWQSDAS